MKHVQKALLCLVLLSFLNHVQAQMTPPGNALNFTPSANIVKVNNILGNFGTGNFTIEAWVMTGAPNANIISKRSSCGYTNFIQLNVVNGKVAFEINGSDNTNYTAIYGNTTVADGKWHHVAIVRNNNSLGIYLDGVPDAFPGGISGNPNINNTDSLTIGNSVCNIPFAGSLDELRFYNAALTTQQIQSDMSSINSSLPNNLLAYYNFDQGMAGSPNAGVTSLVDKQGTNNGTLRNFVLTGPNSNWVTSFAKVGTGASTTAGGTNYMSAFSSPKNANTYYFSPVSANPIFNTQVPINASIVVPAACTADALTITVLRASGDVSNTVTVTLFKNGVATPLTTSATLSANTAIATNTSNPVSLAAGDVITLQWKQLVGTTFERVMVVLHTQ